MTWKRNNIFAVVGVRVAGAVEVQSPTTSMLPTAVFSVPLCCTNTARY